MANKGLEAAAGEQLAHIEDRATSYMGYYIAGNYTTVEGFDEDTAAYEGFNNQIKDGSRFVLNNILGIGGAKKGGNNSTAINSSNSGGGSQGKNSGNHNSSGAENAATYPALKDSLAQQNLNNIAGARP